ncbi:hypothetical protein, partial [Thalassospira sp.]|uniref:hypothetical protein n=1 Tax=Thalassospira sp. TaxID=1912094 RepID=UPI00311F3F0E
THSGDPATSNQNIGFDHDRSFLSSRQNAAAKALHLMSGNVPVWRTIRNCFAKCLDTDRLAIRIAPAIRLIMQAAGSRKVQEASYRGREVFGASEQGASWWCCVAVLQCCSGVLMP